jgi:hypothetical protein
MTNVADGTQVEQPTTHVPAEGWHPLSLIDNWLQAAGWVLCHEGFILPEPYRTPLFRARFGGGITFNRKTATAIQIMYYEGMAVQGREQMAEEDAMSREPF